jgi:hypothetical protein
MPLSRKKESSSARRRGRKCGKANKAFEATVLSPHLSAYLAHEPVNDYITACGIIRNPSGYPPHRYIYQVLMQVVALIPMSRHILISLRREKIESNNQFENYLFEYIGYFLYKQATDISGYVKKSHLFNIFLCPIYNDIKNRIL